MEMQNSKLKLVYPIYLAAKIVELLENAHFIRVSLVIYSYIDTD